MKKLSSILILSALISTALFGLSVDEPELKKTGSETIEFINYTGPHKVIDSLAAIKGIGSGLGSKITPAKASQVGDKNKYYVVHAVDPNETGKLDADIIYIGKNATVDHVKNLRRIISAYLSSAYGYSEKDADTLAVFVTVYNAVYRGKYDTYSSKYKSVVMNNLSKANCGLSVNYKDWPGASEIVIPLYDVNNGGLSTVDTSVISDSKVVDSMKEDEDKNVDPRKDMVDLKEREAEEATDKAQASQKKAAEEQKKLNETKKEAEQAEKKAEEAKKEAEKNPTAENKKAAEEAKKEAEQKKEEVKEQQEKTDEAKKEASEQQTVADKKTSEAQSERKDIAADQQELQKKEAEEAKMPSEYGIILSDEKAMLSRLVRFNTETGEIIKKSPVSYIRNRTIYDTSSDFIAVAGENTGNGTIKLVLISQDTMEITSESNETLAEDSVLVKDGDDYYCVISDDGKYVVGKFGNDLKLKIKSPVAVTSSTPITLTDSGLVVTSASGQLRLLSLKDLTSITKEQAAAERAANEPDPLAK
ncbi:MAG: hypothetical protein MJ162_06260 [Treponema sp.]|nr:hypothetical protein [Treponema sp.]